MRGFDKSSLNQNLLLSLPMFEGTGTVLTQDIAKPHHPVLMTHAPVWTQLSSGIWVLDFTAAHPDYLSCAAASCVDLDFTAGDFSLATWYYLDTFTDAVYLIHRTASVVSGWEIVLQVADLRVRARTNQAGVVQDTFSDAVLTTGSWHLLGVSRSGTKIRIYHDGIDIVWSSGSHTNPASCAKDFRIGVSEWAGLPFDGKLWNPRIWGRKLEPWEHREIFNAERSLFGV